MCDEGQELEMEIFKNSFHFNQIKTFLMHCTEQVSKIKEAVRVVLVNLSVLMNIRIRNVNSSIGKD